MILPRIFVILLSILAAVIVLLWFVWHLAFGQGRIMPVEGRVGGLSAQVQIHWTADDMPLIDAANPADRAAALGYLHGLMRPWQMTLWRQTAEGRLGEWFGPRLLPLDRFSRQLGFAALAEDIFAHLEEEDRLLLEAYSRGVNAAFSERRVKRTEEFALLDVQPEPWEPWHALALERLMSWLATPSIDESVTRHAAEETRTFFASDDLLRRWLNLHGFQHSTAWAVRDSLQHTHFYQRHVYGRSAMPLFQETYFAVQGDTAMVASIPGTLIFPAGYNGSMAWSVFLSNPVRLQPAAPPHLPPLTYQRLHTEDGHEEVLPIQRDPAALYLDVRYTYLMPDTTGLENLAPQPIVAYADSIWTIQWAGLQQVTDLPAWRPVLDGQPPASAFILSGGEGLRVNRDGSWQTTGSPSVVRNLTGGILIGNTMWTDYLAVRLETRLAGEGRHVDVREWTRDYGSAWPVEAAPSMIAAADTLYPAAAEIRDALTYLRNWDYSYDRASIAASIYDTWVTHYRDRTGAFPRATSILHPIVEQSLRVQTLESALQELEERVGPNMTTWRWETVQPNDRTFPVFSVDTLMRHSLARTRYAPVKVLSEGHPSALGWGSSDVQNDLPAPAVWEGWLSTADWGRFFTRRNPLRMTAFLGRYMVSEGRPPSVALNRSEVTITRTITLASAGR